MTIEEAYNQTLAEGRYANAQDFWERVGFKAGVSAATARKSGLPAVRVARAELRLTSTDGPRKHHRFCRQ